MNALRGHSNIQGLTDLGLLSNLLPGYLTLPREAEQDYDAYIAKRTAKPLRPGQLSYWQNYRKFHVSLMKAWFGKSATKENNWCYDWLPKLDMPGAGYDVLRYFDMMYQGKVNGYFCQGFNPVAASFPQQGQGERRFRQAEVPGDDGPAGHRDLGVLAQRRRVQRRRHRQQIQTEVFRLPTTCFAEEDGSIVNSGRWLQWHWKGAEPPGEAQERHRDHVADLHAPAQDVPEGGRRVPRPDPQPDLALFQPAEPDRGRTGDGVQRQGAGGPGRPQGPDHGHAQGRRAAARLCPAARRRHHRQRLLDLRRLLDPAGQPDGPPRQQRPLRHGPDPGLGLGVAGEPAHPLQPRLGRRQRQAVGPEPQPGVVERQVLGRHRHPGLQGRRTPGRRHGPVHHEPRRRGAPVRRRQDGRRAVPGALRAVRDAAGHQPAAPEPAGDQQPGGAGVQERHGTVRHGGQVPLRGHHLPAHRALPLLDQARPRSTPSRSPSSSSRSARRWPRNWASMPATA